ncbi:MAG: hypothetical protein IKZ55_01730, partial [Bacteroidales bacterium]|nr:hypothetical protein [Bacteroidales bacterium]
RETSGENGGCQNDAKRRGKMADAKTTRNVGGKWRMPKRRETSGENGGCQSVGTKDDRQAVKHSETPAPKTEETNLIKP